MSTERPSLKELFLEEASAQADFKSKAAVSYEVGAALRVAGDFGIGASIVYMLPIRGPWQIAVFGGPSYFKLEQDVVRDVNGEFGLDSRFNVTLDLSEALIEPSRGSAWGYNPGANFAYRLGRNVGIGTSVRYSRASIDVENAFEATRTERPGGPVPVTVGGLTVTGGLQVRF